MREPARLAVGFVVAALLVTVAAGTGTGKPTDRVEQASRLIFTPGATDDAIREGFVLLLDAAVDAAADAKMPSAFTSKIAEARRRMRDVSLVDAKAVTLLEECYAEVHGGTPFRMPASVKSPSDASVHGRGLLEPVPALLKQGKPRDALSRMLEAAVAIVTPVEQ